MRNVLYAHNKRWPSQELRADLQRLGCSMLIVQV